MDGGQWAVDTWTGAGRESVTRSRKQHPAAGNVTVRERVFPHPPTGCFWCASHGAARSHGPRRRPVCPVTDRAAGSGHTGGRGRTDPMWRCGSAPGAVTGARPRSQRGVRFPFGRRRPVSVWSGAAVPDSAGDVGRGGYPTGLAELERRQTCFSPIQTEEHGRKGDVADTILENSCK